MIKPHETATKENASCYLAFALHCLDQSQHHCPADFLARRANLELDAEGAVKIVFNYLEANKERLP